MCYVPPSVEILGPTTPPVFKPGLTSPPDFRPNWRRWSDRLFAISNYRLNFEQSTELLSPESRLSVCRPIRRCRTYKLIVLTAQWVSRHNQEIIG